LITSCVGKERAEEQLNDVKAELELTRSELREQLKAFSDENKKLRYRQLFLYIPKKTFII
jgi:CRISPR/Cas system Type II protein with McrA/HNH and RuvC-like nuclease domain